MNTVIRRKIQPVLRRFGVRHKTILSRMETGNLRKGKKFSHPRNVSMYLIRQSTDLSYPQIAREFGCKNHVTVMLACRRVQADPKLLSIAKEFSVSGDPSFDEAQASYESSMESGEEPTIHNEKEERKKEWQADQFEDENR